MASFQTYNNNQDNKPTVNVYTPISFSNPGSKVMDTKFGISYFNRMMVLAIAGRSNSGSEDYATYDNDNAVKVFVSYHKAKILHDAILDMLTNKDKNNVCIELKNGLLKISNGVEYGSTFPCISISYADKDGNVNEIVYETKETGYEAAYDYSDGNYSTLTFPRFEIETFLMVLDQYYKASSYAIAATIRESTMYRDKYNQNAIKAIAEKVGASFDMGGSKGSFNNKTFLSQGGSTGSTTFSGDVPKEFEQSSFEDIANGLMS